MAEVGIFVLVSLGSFLLGRTQAVHDVQSRPNPLLSNNEEELVHEDVESSNNAINRSISMDQRQRAHALMVEMPKPLYLVPRDEAVDEELSVSESDITAVKIPEALWVDWATEYEDWERSKCEENLYSVFDELAAPFKAFMAAWRAVALENHLRQSADGEQLERLEASALAITTPANTNGGPRVCMHPADSDQGNASQDTDDESLCIVCFCSIPENHHACFLPCGHTGLCYGCALEASISLAGACPICRTTIASIVTCGHFRVLEVDEGGAPMDSVDVGCRADGDLPWTSGADQKEARSTVGHSAQSAVAGAETIPDQKMLGRSQSPSPESKGSDSDDEDSDHSHHHQDTSVRTSSLDSTGHCSKRTNDSPSNDVLSNGTGPPPPVDNFPSSPKEAQSEDSPSSAQPHCSKKRRARKVLMAYVTGPQADFIDSYVGYAVHST